MAVLFRRRGLRVACLVACALRIAPAMATITVTNTNDSGPAQVALNMGLV